MKPPESVQSQFEHQAEHILGTSGDRPCTRQQVLYVSMSYSGFCRVPRDPKHEFMWFHIDQSCSDRLDLHEPNYSSLNIFEMGIEETFYAYSLILMALIKRFFIDY